MNETAPAGSVYVCHACGKRSTDKYGFKPISRGWDASCMMNAGLYKESELIIENGRVVDIISEPETEE